MFQEILKKVALKLRELDIPYMVIGGQALLVHGEPRLTRDIDITLGAGLERLQGMLDAAGGISLRPLADDPEGFAERTMVLPCVDDESGVRVDFIFSLTPYERQAIDRAVKVQLAGTEVNFASAEDLVIHKVFAKRPRDLEDARSVIRRHPDLDVPYIRSWLALFHEADPEAGYPAILDSLLEDGA